MLRSPEKIEKIQAMDIIAQKNLLITELLENSKFMVKQYPDQTSYSITFHGNLQLLENILDVSIRKSKKEASQSSEMVIKELRNANEMAMKELTEAKTQLKELLSSIHLLNEKLEESAITNANLLSANEYYKKECDSLKKTLKKGLPKKEISEVVCNDALNKQSLEIENKRLGTK